MSRPLPSPDSTGTAPPWRAALLFGVGLAGTLDEVILHQLLHWHHFYDRSTPAVGLVSDGVFHIVSTVCLAAGAVMLARGHPWPAGWGRQAVAGTLVGAGAFNLYDGVVQHKILRLHQVRPSAPHAWPYDVGFIGLAVIVLAAGLLVRRTPATR